MEEFPGVLTEEVDCKAGFVSGVPWETAKGKGTRNPFQEKETDHGEEN